MFRPHSGGKKTKGRRERPAGQQTTRLLTLGDLRLDRRLRWILAIYVVLIGGIDTGMFRPLVFTYDGSWSNVSPPDGPNLLGGFGQTVTYDADISRMLSLAGVGTSDDTLWTLGATWTELCTTCSGAARRDASMVYDPSLHTVWMTGGATSGSDDGLAGTWVLQGSSWKQVFTDPPGRAASALAYDPGRDVIVLYGGNSSLNCAPQCDETWELVPD
jgi:hypothetical protein